MKIVAKRISKWLAITLLALILIIGSTLGLLLFTPLGINTLLWGAQQALPTFKVAKSQGQLLDGLWLEGVDIQVAAA